VQQLVASVLTRLCQYAPSKPSFALDCCRSCDCRCARDTSDVAALSCKATAVQHEAAGRHCVLITSLTVIINVLLLLYFLDRFFLEHLYPSLCVLIVNDITLDEGQLNTL
jgi:hypothetical protein